MEDLQKPTIREHITGTLRDNILEGTYPPGSKLVESALAKEFGISRGPIREALRELEQEHLVEYSRNIGCVVRTVSIMDAYETYYLRANYEIMALRQAKGQFTADELCRMEMIQNSMQLLKTMPKKTLIELDNDFHRVIVAKSNLPILIHSWDVLGYGNYLASRSTEDISEHLTEVQYTKHKNLLDILRKQDMEFSCRAIFHHYMYPLREEFERQGIDTENYRFEY